MWSDDNIPTDFQLEEMKSKLNYELNQLLLEDSTAN